MAHYNDYDDSDSTFIVISGFVKDAQNGESLIGALVYVEEINSAALTNNYGFYSLRMKPGVYTLIISYFGYEDITTNITVTKSLTLNYEMVRTYIAVDEVVVTAQRKDENVTNLQMSSVQVNAETIKKMPALMGEVDILKTIQLLPGVQNSVEGNSGFSVRGGTADQNLLILDEAPVYNANHLMGFFSVFNGDAIKEMTLYKGDMPAQYGGRLSSILDVRMKDGNSKKFAASGGIGSISSRLTVEGPIIKDTSSFIISGRRTYADMFLQFAKDSALQNNQLYFYDLNVKANYTINDNNRLFVSGYFGRDVFAFRDFFNMRWGNATYTVRWNNSISSRIFSNYSFIHSNYYYGVELYQSGYDLIMESGIVDYGFKADYNFYVNSNNTLKFGFNTVIHTIHPGKIRQIKGDNTVSLSSKKSGEHALFLSNSHKISRSLSAQYGMRYSIAHNIGEETVYDYNEQYIIIDSTVYSKGEIFNVMHGIEPRASINFLCNSSTAIKSSYSRTIQNMQLVSNSNSGMPTDVWFTASPNIKPQISNQVAVGVFKNLRDNKFEISAEGYYKKMDNQIDFRDNAQLFFNDKLERELRIGTAQSYGVEVLMRKQEGTFTGWIGYTFSKSIRKVDEINNGNWYNSNFDKPHNLTVMANYEVNSRIQIGANFVLTSGAPTSLPTARWEYGGVIMPYYSERNGYRLPTYHRIDVSSTIQLNKKTRTKYTSELNISIYNVYNRKNPFTIYFEPEEQGSYNVKAYALSMFGIVPSVTWNFKF